MSDSDNDVSFGCRAVEAGLIGVKDLAEALRELWQSKDGPDTLWQVLVARGAIDLDQAALIQRQVEDGIAVDSPTAAFLPDPAERYVFEKRLGQGGMGVVRQVRDRALGRVVAMKVLPGDDAMNDESVGTLVTEARVAGMLEHPNIIPVYDVGVLPTGEPYYTMRLLDRMSLRDVLDLLRDGNPEAAREFPLLSLMRVFQSVCMGVDYAHSRGVIHRDLKPDNVRLGRFGEVQVADWGLARFEGFPDLPLRKALQEAEARGEKDPCIVIGSPNYMSPEQACGLNDRVGPASDIYGLGCILYEILTLSAPIEDVDTMTLLDRVELEELITPSQRAPNRVIPPSLEELCMASLTKNPDDRIQDVRVLWRAVEGWLVGQRERERADAQSFDEVQRGHRYGSAYRRFREARAELQAQLGGETDPLRRTNGERELRALEVEIATTWAEAYDAYTRALGHNQRDLVARAKVAELAWARLSDAEASGDEVGCQLYWSLLRRHNDGAYDTYVVGASPVTVETVPPGATVYVRSFADAPLVPESPPGRAVGRTPVTRSLAAGLYLITVELAGWRSTTRPVFLHAGLERTINITLEAQSSSE